tara:strand:- start:878 stop:1690 length:813 start_codon:yes stop_codon:yes gene_type:complete
MLATPQSGNDFKQANEHAQDAVRAVFNNIPLDSNTVILQSTPAAKFRAMPSDVVGVVEEGLVSILHNNTVVSVLECGDLLIPDTDYLTSEIGSLIYGSEGGAKVRTYSKSSLLAILATDSLRMEQWMRAISLQISLHLRLNALHIRYAGGADGVPEVFPKGAIIIRQGDPADDIFSMSDGEAEVLVNDMPVATIQPGELFGTMAALMGTHRNATVRAIKRCNVVRVPKDRFFELIRSRPAAVQGLLADMAHSITKLNEEVVTLRRRQHGT